MTPPVIATIPAIRQTVAAALRPRFDHRLRANDGRPPRRPRQPATPGPAEPASSSPPSSSTPRSSARTKIFTATPGPWNRIPPTCAAERVDAVFHPDVVTTIRTVLHLRGGAKGPGRVMRCQPARPFSRRGHRGLEVVQHRAPRCRLLSAKRMPSRRRRAPEQMLRDLNSAGAQCGLAPIACAAARRPALSSRNVYLDAEQRRARVRLRSQRGEPARQACRAGRAAGAGRWIRLFAERDRGDSGAAAGLRGGRGRVDAATPAAAAWRSLVALAVFLVATRLIDNLLLRNLPRAAVSLHRGGWRVEGWREKTSFFSLRPPPATLHPFADHVFRTFVWCIFSLAPKSARCCRRTTIVPT